MELGGDDPDLFNNLAYLEAEIGSELDDALALIQKALSRSPGNSQYTDTAGFVYLKKGDTATALRLLESLSTEYRENPGFRYHFALALLKSGDETRGERELRTAVAQDPSLASPAEVHGLLRSN